MECLKQNQNTNKSKVLSFLKHDQNLGWGCAIGVPPTSRLELQVRRLHKPLRPSGFGKAQTVPKSGRVWWFKVSWLVVEPPPVEKNVGQWRPGSYMFETTKVPVNRISVVLKASLLVSLRCAVWFFKRDVLLVRHCRDTSKCLACFKSLES